MSANPATCPRCGSTRPHSDGPCPRCACSDALNSPASDEFNPDYIDKLPLPGKTRVIADKYTILETIARGGMGVVYKARQENLNRIVAVKMLLGGVHASGDYKRRFVQEAKAAAKLNHPNIVSIHDWGEDAGQPFFSMDYIEGKTLAEMARDKPLPPRQAAEIVCTLAQAMHYAHTQGILHRDLKPSNVLVDTTSVPRITDFGLARETDQATMLTGTGNMLGTPGFLPPEQVSSKRGQSGPHSDVYGLGAILYYLLTSRPPHLANTVAEALRAVEEREPVPVRRLNRTVPLDLETICLKCLQKDSRRRYPSAQALAEDLDRFLTLKPITARPVGLAEQGCKWARRNPVGIILLGTAIAIATLVWQWPASSPTQFVVTDHDFANVSEKVVSSLLASGIGDSTNGPALVAFGQFINKTSQPVDPEPLLGQIRSRLLATGKFVFVTDSRDASRPGEAIARSDKEAPLKPPDFSLSLRISEIKTDNFSPGGVTFVFQFSLVRLKNRTAVWEKELSIDWMSRERMRKGGDRWQVRP